MPDKMRVLAFGGCQLHPPMDLSQAFIQPFHTVWNFRVAHYSMAEMLRTIYYSRRELCIDPTLRIYCSIPEQDIPKAPKIDEVDLVLLEPNTPIDIFLGDLALHRSSITSLIIEGLRDIDPDMGNAAGDWFNYGLMSGKPEAMRELADRIAPYITHPIPHPETVKEILYGARIQCETPEQFTDNIATLREMLKPLPMGIVAYTYQYLPDGRRLSWPPDHLANTISAAKQLNIPLYDPEPLIKRYGVSTAYRPDGKVYRLDFLPIVGEELKNFAQRIVD